HAVREVRPDVIDDHVVVVVLGDRDLVRAGDGLVVERARAHRAVVDGYGVVHERDVRARELRVDERTQLVGRLRHGAADREVRAQLDGARGERLGLALDRDLIRRLRRLVAGQPLLWLAAGREHESEGNKGTG